MTEDDVPLTRRESLSLFPEAILWDVVEDDQFRDVLGVKLDGVIVFDGDKARYVVKSDAPAPCVIELRHKDDIRQARRLIVQKRACRRVAGKRLDGP